MLETSWESRHNVIDEPIGAAVQQKGHVSLCCGLNYCICNEHGRLVSWFWSSMMLSLKGRFSRDSTALRSGTVVLLWKGHSGNGCVERAVCTHIALHYLRPWRPSFLVTALEEPLDRLGDLTAITILAAGAQFMSAHEVIHGLDLQLTWDVSVGLLSTKAIPWPHSSGKARVEMLDEPPLAVWQGLQRERERRRRCADRGVPVPDVAEGEQEEPGTENIDEDVDEVLEYLLADASSGSEDSDASGSSRSSQCSNSSSSSSSSSTDRNSNVVAEAVQQQAQQAQQQPVLQAMQQEERQEGEALQRRVRPQSFDWGAFRFTYKEPSSYQATCRLHSRHERTKCTKLASWNGGFENAGPVVHALKCWCLRGNQHDNRQQHQGPRGLPRLTAEELRMTPAQLDEQLARMGPLAP